MDKKHFGLLYRYGTEEASNTMYTFSLNEVMDKAKEGKLGLSFVQRYDNLTIEQVNNILKEVFPYRGPQKTLLEKINEIVPPAK